MPDSLIMIPDISGFTDFVNATEISHSQHIISELLELLIKTQTLGMEVAEIEGDAILFYKENETSTVEQVIQQGEKMFLQFHRHLKEYENNRVCNCGACSTAINLSLKIVAHKSEIGFTDVNNKKKPFGPGIVLAHRFLKNDIPVSGYVLFSDKWFAELEDYSQKITNGSEFKEGKKEYEKFGELSYKYLDLSYLYNRVNDVEPIITQPLTKNPLVFEGIINSSIELIFEVISNLDYRHEWNKDVKEIRYDKTKLNRVGTKHICVFSGNQVEFETISGNSKSNRYIYGEKLEKAPFNKKIDFYFILEEIEPDKTKLKIEVHFQPVPVIGYLVLPFIKNFQKSVLKKNFFALKQFCEEKNALTQGQ